MPYPKIELHVHLEATLRPELLFQIAHRNEYPLPVDTVEGLRGLYQYHDFDHFMEVWTLVTNALRRADDFRQLVVGYAGEASRHGAVYLEGIFSPIERTWRAWAGTRSSPATATGCRKRRNATASRSD